jgi:DNA-binding MurR/RpiR family transcriptional regulator
VQNIQDNPKSEVSFNGRYRKEGDGRLWQTGARTLRLTDQEREAYRQIFAQEPGRSSFSLRRRVGQPDRAAIHQAVHLLRERERVFVFGIGPSISLVNLLEIRLRRFGRQVIPLTTSGREILEPLLLMTGSDLLFAIGFFDVTPALQLVLNHAQACGCVCILLTDTLGSIIGNQADVVLAARRGPISAFHSLTVPMTIINTLLLALAQTDQERAMSNLDRLDELRQTYAFTSE